MKKWSLRPDPGIYDQARYVLLVKGEMRHITQIVKKFGAMCGRPIKVDHPEGFNFRIYMHGLTSSGLEQVSRYLEEIAPGTKEGVAGAGAGAQPAPHIQDVLSVPVAELFGAAPPAGAAIPAAGPVLTPLFPGAQALPDAAAAPAAPPAAKPLWGLQSALDPMLNFDTLMVGAYNRFAHAAATSVVGSPGAMYNPLFIHGVPGVGKTHILHAIGAALKKNWDDSALILTTGAGLAAAVSAALAEGQLAKIEEALAGAKALLVDDAHLLSVTEANQASLAKIFHNFFTNNLQVVFTSVYPPRALGGLEESLKISLSKGWTVDMKMPNSVVQEDIISAFVARSGVQISSEALKRLHEKLGAGYAEFPSIVLRWGALTALQKSQGQGPTSDYLIGELINTRAPENQAGLPNAAQLDMAKAFQPPGPGYDARNLALFCPKGQDAMAPWLVHQFYQTAAQFGITCTYRHVLCEAYDAEQPFGAPFQIGDSSRRAGAQAALVLGPGPQSKLAAREGEFAHAVRHVLESYGVAAGWIPFSEVSGTRPFLAAHLDFAAPRQA